MELAVRDDRLILLWGGNERAVTRVGADLYTLAHESRGPIPFRIALGEDGRPEYLQMFLWAFRRVGAKDAAPAR
jgi:hypothetical protein